MPGRWRPTSPSSRASPRVPCTLLTTCPGTGTDRHAGQFDGGWDAYREKGAGQAVPTPAASTKWSMEGPARFTIRLTGLTGPTAAKRFHYHPPWPLEGHEQDHLIPHRVSQGH